MRLHTKLLYPLVLMLPITTWGALTPKSHIGLAGIDFQAKVNTEFGFDNNVTYQSDKNDQIASDYYQLSPELKAIGVRGDDRYLLMYQGKYRKYTNSSNDDYADHNFLVNGSWRFGLRHGLQLNLVQDFGHEERGTELTEGFKNWQFESYGFDSVMPIKNTDSSLRYSYGAPNARGKLSFLAQLKTFRYEDLNRIKEPDITSSPDDETLLEYARKQEWNESTYLIELFDQVSSDSRFRYTLLTNQRRYINAHDKDSNEYYLIYGIKTHRTGKTLIDANIAWLYKEFLHKGSQDENFNGLNWDVMVEWKPVNYSSVTLSTSQRVKDPDESGGYVLVTKYGIAWQHSWWVDRLSTTLSYDYQYDDYKNISYKREKNIKLISLGVDYDFRPSISLGLKYTDKVFDSTPDEIDFGHSPVGLRNLDYDKSQVVATLKVQI
ncbi:outer membrane beta-barrel protein [Photobacterium damselae]|uniref:outer membrane beta-barrel protein n=1 Tax=Photobacterium damselae TaxID=38293 RepID=UPI002543DBD6